MEERDFAPQDELRAANQTGPLPPRSAYQRKYRDKVYVRKPVAAQFSHVLVPRHRSSGDEKNSDNEDSKNDSVRESGKFDSSVDEWGDESVFTGTIMDNKKIVL